MVRKKAMFRNVTLWRAEVNYTITGKSFYGIALGRKNLSYRWYEYIKLPNINYISTSKIGDSHRIMLYLHL